MSYRINKEKCIGCGLCTNLCPEVFELGEDGKARVKQRADLGKNNKCVEKAKESCPVGAIEETS